MRTRWSLGAHALGALAIGGHILAGCDRSPPLELPPVTSPSSESSPAAASSVAPSASAVAPALSASAAPSSSGPPRRSALTEASERDAPEWEKCPSTSTKNPFASLGYDRVVAYGYPDEGGDSITSVDEESGKFAISGAKEKVLDASETLELVALLGSPASYGQPRAACFIPHHTFAFYRGDEIVGYVDVCFQCNQLRSTPLIPVSRRFNIKRDDFCADFGGLSSQAIRHLQKLCKKWELGGCD